MNVYLMKILVALLAPIYESIKQNNKVMKAFFGHEENLFMGETI